MYVPSAFEPSRRCMSVGSQQCSYIENAIKSSQRVVVIGGVNGARIFSIPFAPFFGLFFLYYFLV